MKHTILALLVTWPLAMAAQTPILVKTFPNPTPAEGEYFGWAMAPLGNDHVIVGAPYAGNLDFYTYSVGEAYLFASNGTLLNTFTNPTPETGDLFGSAIASIGNDLILIAAYSDNAAAENAGVIHLIAPNGALLNTISNPQPTESANFGYSLAVMGNDRFVAGAPGEFSGGRGSTGVAYLMSTNGTLLATFTNPAPTLGDNFGFTVATVGTEYVLIGAPWDDQGAVDAGRAYLFRTNGALVTTFDNPTPADNDYFSYRLSAFDNDRVLIGCPRDSSTVSMAGAAYLFDINGTLLKTFTQNSLNQNFGIPTALGNLVLIGAPSDNTGAAGAGAAYLYTPNGTLVTTITNPAPASGDHFGYKVVPVGTDRVLISGEWEANSVGEVYLYGVPLPPSLTIHRTGFNTVTVSWPAAASNFVLQENTNNPASISWSNITSGIVNDGTTKTLVADPASGTRFYRLAIP